MCSPCETASGSPTISSACDGSHAIPRLTLESGILSKSLCISHISIQLCIHKFHSPELEVTAWKYKTYLDPAVEGPPLIIPITEVLSQACRLTLTVQEIRSQDVQSDDDDDVREGTATDQAPCETHHVWMTVGLTRVRALTYLICYLLHLLACLII